jgi:hypothetical protein
MAESVKPNLLAKAPHHQTAKKTSDVEQTSGKEPRVAVLLHFDLARGGCGRPGLRHSRPGNPGR